MRRVQRPGGCVRSGESRTVEGTEASDLLGTLADEDSRALLQAANGEALSVSELSETCDLPLSTTYRKVNQLTEAGLFEERIRLSKSGKHTSEYAIKIEAVNVALSGDCIDIVVSDQGESERSTSTASVPTNAD